MSDRDWRPGNPAYDDIKAEQADPPIDDEGVDIEVEHMEVTPAELLTEVSNFLSTALINGSGFVVIADMCLTHGCTGTGCTSGISTFPDQGQALAAAYAKDLELNFIDE